MADIEEKHGLPDNTLIRIKEGASVWMDRRCFIWGTDLGLTHIDKVFKIRGKWGHLSSYDCMAFGYGYDSSKYKDDRAYGCGSITVKHEDILPLSLEEAKGYKEVIPPKPKQHLFSIESLYHFKCGECHKWWTVGDFNIIQTQFITCPHCAFTADMKEGKYVASKITSYKAEASSHSCGGSCKCHKP